MLHRLATYFFAGSFFCFDIISWIIWNFIYWSVLHRKTLSHEAWNEIDSPWICSSFPHPSSQLCIQICIHRSEVRSLFSSSSTIWVYLTILKLYLLCSDNFASPDPWLVCHYSYLHTDCAHISFSNLPIVDKRHPFRWCLASSCISLHSYPWSSSSDFFHALKFSLFLPAHLHLTIKSSSSLRIHASWVLN